MNKTKYAWNYSWDPVLFNAETRFFLNSDPCGRGLKPLWRAVSKRRGSIELIHSVGGFNCMDGKEVRKKWNTLCGVKNISMDGAICTGEKRFTLAEKVYNCWTLTLIGHPYSSARIQTKPYQLKGWIRTKRAWNGGKKWWTTMESRSKFPRRTCKIETSSDYRGIIENKVVGTFNNNQHFVF